MTAVSGAALTANFFLPKERERCRLFAKWLVETEIAFSVEEQFFISTTARQIHFKSACAFSGNFGSCMTLFCMFCCRFFFKEFCEFTKEFVVIILEGIWIGKRFPKLVIAISYVQMLVSFEHVVAAMVSELLKEKDTVLTRSLC